MSQIKTVESTRCQILTNDSRWIHNLLYQCPCDSCQYNTQRAISILKIRKFLRSRLKHRPQPKYKQNDSLKSIDDKTTDYKYKKWMYHITNQLTDHQIILKMILQN